MTTTLKKFSQSTRLRLLEAVEDKLNYVLNTDSAGLRDYAESIQALRADMQQLGKDALIDKVAYTWFNRLMALRFMDANDYQPLRLKVVSPRDGFTLPEILDEAAQGRIPEELKVDKQKVNDLLDGKIAVANPQNEVYRLLLIASCNYLYGLFPFLFEKLKDYTELLLPDDLTSELSIIQDFVNGMTEEDCRETEMIGWLYQFYISDKKDEVFASKSKVAKEEIPAATQLFTPRWIVEYMVQNTVGKLWLQNNPDSALSGKMPYYIETESSKAEDFLKINSPEEITLLDQACGSGHILVYGFELLYQIYEEAGYTASQIPQLIIEKNLFGYEIDERAAQLASFSVLMKARSYYRRLFRDVVKPNILCYTDLRLTDDETENAFQELGYTLTDELKYDLQCMQQATNFGSLIQPRTAASELEKLEKLLSEKRQTDDIFIKRQYTELHTALAQLHQLSKKTCCIVDNPPYMGGGNMNKELSDFVKINYPDSKADLMACFMEAGLASLKPKGFLGMINQHSWMFLSSYEKLRKTLIDNIQFDTLLHLGPRTFPEIGGEVVQNASFTFINVEPKRKSVYIRLVDYRDSQEKSERTLEAIQSPNCGWFYIKNQKDFEKIPGNNIGYWLNPNELLLLSSETLSWYGSAREGMSTGNNEKYVREWFCVNYKHIKFHAEEFDKASKWFPYNKDGQYRKWYGNQNEIINWHNNGYELQNTLHPSGKRIWAHNFNLDFILKPFITWSSFGSKKITARYFPNGFLFDSSGLSYFPKPNVKYEVILAFINSKILLNINDVINSGLSFKPGYFGRIPYPKKAEKNETIETLVFFNVQVSRQEWNSRETSWDFEQNELIRLNGQDIEEAIDLYKAYWTKKFIELHQNEEELNRQFIEIYGLEEDLDPNVPLEDITILRDELNQRELKEISEKFRSGWELVDGKMVDGGMVDGEGCMVDGKMVDGEGCMVDGEMVDSEECMVDGGMVDGDGKSLVSSKKVWRLSDRDKQAVDGSQPPTVNQPLTTNHQPLTTNHYPPLPFNTKELVQQFISYAVGCMFGRYSLNKKGLILANQGETVEDYYRIVKGENLMTNDSLLPTHDSRLTTHDLRLTTNNLRLTTYPDPDGIIPVLEDEWFVDDVVTQFRAIVKAVWGERDLQRNMDFIERELGKPIRNYFYRDFYNDHLQRYKKRPIYWLFSSPNGSFQALIYLHRYNQDTLTNMLNDYLRPFADKLEHRIEHLNQIIVEGSPREKTQAAKDIVRIEKMIDEVRKYDREVLYPLALDRLNIDLDDGVLVNYNRLGAAVKMVAGLNDAATRKKVEGFEWVDVSGR